MVFFTPVLYQAKVRKQHITYTSIYFVSFLTTAAFIWNLLKECYTYLKF